MAPCLTYQRQNKLVETSQQVLHKFQKLHLRVFCDLILLGTFQQVVRIGSQQRLLSPEERITIMLLQRGKLSYGAK